MRIKLLVLLLAALSLSCSDVEKRPSSVSAAADPSAARKLIKTYSCPACHVVPGLDGVHGSLGPSLEGIGSRGRIAGGVPNNRETMIAFLQNPRAVHPQAAMPALGISRDDARVITAYLFTLK